jgi:segregation and condensation protein B
VSARSKNKSKGSGAPASAPSTTPPAENGRPTIVDAADAPDTIAPPEASFDAEATVNLTGDMLDVPARDDSAEGAEPAPDTQDEDAGVEQARALSHAHLCALLEALVFASDKPMKAIELARLASAPVKQVRELLAELKGVHADRGVVLDEVAGGWLFRTHVQFAPFVRELSAQRPVRLTRAQVETLAIIAYRQPITRPEIDDVRGVDSGATLKLLLERDLVRILGKKDEPGRPLLYGTTSQFLEFFGLKSLKDLPTLHEFTELNEESRRVAEAELGDVLAGEGDHDGTHGANEVHDTIAPPPPSTRDELEGDEGDEASDDEPDGAGAPSNRETGDPPE